MPAPQYGGVHQRVRKALLAAYRPGQPCARCGEPTCPPASALHLDHETDAQGRQTGRYLGLSHARCNVAANAYNKLGRAAGRDPQRQREAEARNARRELREGRAELGRVQAAIAAGDAGRDW
jgi:hypothetical protein